MKNLINITMERILPLSKRELEGVQSKIPNQQAPHAWNLKPKEQHLKGIV